MERITKFLFLSIFFCMTSQFVHAESYDLIDLGLGLAHDINDKGQIVGRDDNEALFWPEPGIGRTILNAYAGTNGQQAEGINEAGQIVGMKWPEAVFWADSTSEMIYLNAYNAHSINNLGQIIGGDPYQPFYWENSSSPPTTMVGNFAVGKINDNGEIVGTNYNGIKYTNEIHYAVYWSNKNSIPIALQNLIGASQSQGMGINNSGQLVGDSSFTNGIYHPVFWENNTSSPVDLGTLGGSLAQAKRINEAGQIVGFAQTPEGEEHAVFWSNSGSMIVDLNNLIPNDSGWILQNAADINNLGIIVGHGLFYGEMHAFALVPILNSSPIADAGDNIQITSAEQVFTIIVGSATDPDGDYLEYRWLRGAEGLLDWTSVGLNGEANLTLAYLPYLEIGNHTLTLEVRDGSGTTSDDMLLTIENSPPQVQPAPITQVGEIGVDPITIIANVSDFDGDRVSYEYLKGTDVLASGTLETIQGGYIVQVPDLVIQAGDPMFTVGDHQIEIRVSDSINIPVSAFVTVSVIDTSVPSLSPLPNITLLWPPDHTLQPVTVQANAFDNGGGIIHLDVSVISSELPDMDADGNTIPDYYIDSVNESTGIIELRLRSERSGKGDGRVYTIHITATDESGNQSHAYINVLAPHDRRMM